MKEVVDSARRAPVRRLDPAIRAEFETRFGHDFSRVRLHTDVAEARELRAEAFTFGEHIFFAPGHWSPETPRGRDLLAHELVHTVQHRSEPPAPHRLSRPGEPLETEASVAVRGHRPLISQSSPLAAGVISRRVDTVLEVEAEGKQKIIEWRSDLILRHLKTDPDDKSGRVRRLLARMAADARGEVLDRVRERLSGAGRERLERALAEPAPAEAQTDTVTAPAPELSPADTPPPAESPSIADEPPAFSADQAKTEEPPAAIEPATPEDALTPAQEGPPKKPAVANEKVEQAAAEKGPEAPKAADPSRPPATGGSGVATAAAGEAASIATPEADTAAVSTPLEPAGPATEAAAPTAAPESAGDSAATAGATEAAPAESGTTTVEAPAPQAAIAESPAAPGEAATESPTTTGVAETAAAEAPAPEAATAESSVAPGGAATESAVAPDAVAPDAAVAPPAPEESSPESIAAEAPVGDEAPAEGQSATSGSADSSVAEAPASEAAAAEAPAPDASEPNASEGAVQREAAAPAAEETAPDTPQESAAASAESPTTTSSPDSTSEAAEPQSPERPVSSSPDEAAQTAPGAIDSEATSAASSGAGGAELTRARETVAPTGPLAASAPVASPAVASAPVASLGSAPISGGGGAGPATEVAEPEGSEPAMAVGVVETPTQPAPAEETVETPAPAEPAPAPPAGQGGDPAAAPGGCAPGPDDMAKPADGEGGEGGGGGGPCGGGGGGGGAEEQPAPAAPPNVAQADPAAAMGAVANLPPAQLQVALGSVSQAASTAVSKQKEELAANPPQMERPSGVPAQRDPSVPVLPPGVPPAKDPKAIERAAAGEAIPVPQPEPLPPPPPSPTQALAGPRLPGDAPLTEADTAKVQAAVRNLPTVDPALDVTAGAPPQLDLAGDADPKRADEQRAKVEQGATDARAQGLQDVAQPMGENDIYPTVPKETLTADTGEGGGPGALGALAACAEGGAAGLAKAEAAGGGAAADETVSIVAKEKKGDEITASVGKAQGDMVAKQQDNAAKIADEKSKSQKEVDTVIEENAVEQKGERTKAREDSLKLRTDWNGEQETLTGDARADALKTTDGARKEITDKQAGANKEAVQHIDTGNKEAASARQDAEKKAQGEKQKAEKESPGFLGWLSSKVTSFFDGLKSLIGDIFAAARKLVNAAIDKAKKLATGIIETARKAVVGLIRIAGDALIAIGDRVLAGFPNLRDKFRKGVQDRVKAAEDAVNKLADTLKAGVQKLLDLLGKAINAYLGLLECAYMAAVKAVEGVVKGAIEFAKNVIQAFAAFAALIKDVAADPGGWLSNLGAAVVSGLKNCFWNAFKSAVKNWFNSKVEEVLGLPILIFKMLFKGCIKMKDIGKMAWQGLKAAIPMVLVQLLIEKLVAMIVPAAGAILTIIEGLRAAWGTVSRIIAAFSLFFIFLKAVRGGNAAGPFAAALAAAGIVVIDFVANWLLMRLRKPAGAVAGRLRALAQKIAAGLKRGFAAVKKGAKVALGAIKRGVVAVGKGIKRGATVAAGAIKRGVTAVGRGLKRGAQAVVGGVKRGAQAVGRGLTKVGQAIAKTKVGKALIRGARAVQRGYARGKAAFQKKKQQFKEWREKRKKDKEKRKAEKRARAEGETIAAIERMLSGDGVASLSFRARLLWLKVKWGWKSLRVVSEGPDSFYVDGAMSPGKRLVGTITENMKVLGVSPIVKMVGGQSRLLVGEEQEKTPETVRGVEAARAKEFARFGQPKEEKKGWQELEDAAKAQYSKITAPREGVTPGRIGAPKMTSDWHLQGKRESGFFKPERFGSRVNKQGKVEMLSLMEATLQADMAAEGQVAKGGGRKMGQLRGYLSGLKREIERLRANNMAAKKVEVRIHYFSDRLPGKATQAFVLQQLVEAELPNVTIFWRRL